MNQEAVRRIAFMAINQDLTPEEAIERAVATQWFLDNNLTDSNTLVIHGPGRQRREVVLK